MVKVYAVRVGTKYGPEYETYLKDKLPSIEFLNKEEHPFILQWNKLRFMELDIDEPICVIDVDIGLENDYMELFEYPIKRGEFLAIPAWWRDTLNERYKINGGFYKYYPKDCKYIVDEYRSKPEYYTTKYIKNKTTVGPVNGEQYFVEDTANSRLKIKTVPQAWVQRAVQKDFIQDGEVKLVHYSWQPTK